MSSTDYKFQGWMGLDKSAAEGHMEWKEYEPKAFEENDVDIKITHCGICGSDLHTLRSGWELIKISMSAPTMYPCVVGHEIVGKAVKVGSKVQHIKVGDRVGVGAQSDSCLGRKPDCAECEAGVEQYCANGTDTYNSKYLNGDKSYGGYADYHRCPSHFVFKIPEALESADVAPMLCGGVTTYSPLKHNGCGPGKSVGIVGVGGLGHFGVLWGKALKADKVVGISRKKEKKEQVLKLGADAYIATDDDEDWETKNAKTLDLIVCTVSSHKMPLSSYLKLLKFGGRFIQVGVPEEGLPTIQAFDLIDGGIFIGGSGIGSTDDIREMLQLAADQKVKPWIEQRPMKEANQAIIDFEKNPPKFRFTLVNEKHVDA